jgi:hypothetical protein
MHKPLPNPWKQHQHIPPNHLSVPHTPTPPAYSPSIVSSVEHGTPRSAPTAGPNALGTITAVSSHNLPHHSPISSLVILFRFDTHGPAPKSYKRPNSTYTQPPQRVIVELTCGKRRRVAAYSISAIVRVVSNAASIGGEGRPWVGGV